MDGKQYAAHVEAAFRAMWKTWCSRGDPSRKGEEKNKQKG
jgi:hypothetical protein